MERVLDWIVIKYSVANIKLKSNLSRDSFIKISCFEAEINWDRQWRSGYINMDPRYSEIKRRNRYVICEEDRHWRRADRPARWRGYLLRVSAVGSKVSIKQKWHANEQKPSRNPVRAQASIISVSRKWFSSPGSCPEDNNWPRESDAQVGYYPTDAPGTPRRTANFKVALGITPEISMVRYTCAARCSFRSYSSVTESGRRGDKYGKIMR